MTGMSSNIHWKHSPWFSASTFEAFRAGRFIIVDLLSRIASSQPHRASAALAKKFAIS